MHTDITSVAIPEVWAITGVKEQERNEKMTETVSELEMMAPILAAGYLRYQKKVREKAVAWQAQESVHGVEVNASEGENDEAFYSRAA